MECWVADHLQLLKIHEYFDDHKLTQVPNFRPNIPVLQYSSIPTTYN
jgi:hypothetical protein